MKFSENWLRDWIDPKISLKQLTERLTLAGLEVDSVTAIGEELAQIKVGKIVGVEPHPNADRLRVCQVDVGLESQLTIVCGAANARAGINVVVALVGAELPNQIKIKHSKIRGVASEGMLCSASELGLAETSEGILELPVDASVGEDFKTYLRLPDHILEVSITPNRGDCLSIVGMAREVAVLSGQLLTLSKKEEIAPTIKDTLPVRILAPVACPKYLGRIIRGIRTDAVTPLWMQERLRRSGVRSIHPVVDVANYVMLELGQPMHAFDLNTISKGIVVRHSVADEKVSLLDGQTLNLDQPALVIADAEKILAIAGIMGGASSAVTAETTDIFLESAFFTIDTICPTLRHYPLQSDAGHRFERGVDPDLPIHALTLATKLLLEIVGGQAGPITTAVSRENLPAPVMIKLRRDRIERVLGMNMDSARIERILQHLGMKLRVFGESWEVTIPSYRFDLHLEIDLIEELARIYGYNQIPIQMLPAPLVMLPHSERKLPLLNIHHFWMNRGYYEAINYSFIDPKHAHLLDPDHEPLALSNPISSEMSVMRTTLWPGLIQSALYNIHRQQLRVRLFEMGTCFIQEEKGLQEYARMGGIAIGPMTPEQWGLRQRPLDFFDVKADIEALAKLIGIGLQFSPAVHPALHPGRTAQVLLNEKAIGYVGELHPKVQQALNLPLQTYLFELSLNDIRQSTLPKYSPPSKYPSIRRDIAVILAEEISYQQIRATVWAGGDNALQSVQLFDIYRGTGIEPGKKSVALSLTFQLGFRTLRDAEVDEMVKKVVKTLAVNYQAILRE